MFGKGKLWSVSTPFGYLLAFLMISVIIFFCYSSFSATPESPGLVRLIAFIDTITTVFALLFREKTRALGASINRCCSHGLVLEL